MDYHTTYQTLPKTSKTIPRPPNPTITIPKININPVKIAPIRLDNKHNPHAIRNITLITPVPPPTPPNLLNLTSIFQPILQYHPIFLLITTRKTMPNCNQS